MRRGIALAIVVSLCGLAFGCVGREFQSEPTAVPSPQLAASDVTSLNHGLALHCFDEITPDGRVTSADFTLENVPDMNLDRVRDVRDLEAVADVDFAASAVPPSEEMSCDKLHASSDDTGEVRARGGFENLPPEQVMTTQGREPMAPVCTASDRKRAGVVLFIGIGGANDRPVHSATHGDGVRDLMARLMRDYENDAFWQPVGVLSTPEVTSAGGEKNSAMEMWLAAMIRAAARRFPDCLGVVIIGHSHGATAATAVAAAVEAELGPRLAYLVVIDRITRDYAGDARSIPARVPMYYVYQTNAKLLELNPVPITGANVIVNKTVSADAVSAIDCPNPPQPVLEHSCIDNDRRLQDDIVIGINSALSSRRSEIEAAP